MKLPWQIPAVLLVALALASWLAIAGWGRAGDARRELARSEESHKLEVAGIQQAHAVAVLDLKAESNLSQRRLGEALAAAGIHSTPFVTVSGSTGPVHAGGEGLASAHPTAPAAGSGFPSSGAEQRVCLLYAGEDGEIRVTGAAAKTQAGNVAIDAEASAFGLNPERKLFGGPLHLDAKYLSPQVPGPRGAGWGIGATIVGGRDGFTVGPAFAAPSLRLLGIQLEPTAAFTMHRSGDWNAVGQVIFRRAP